jgi:hypothetical protein
VNTAYILGTLSGEHYAYFRHTKWQKQRIFQAQEVGNTAYILGTGSGKTAYVSGTRSGEYYEYCRH